MRNPDRITAMIALLHEAWERNPDMRLGQLIYNIFEPDQACPSLFYKEDDDVMDDLERWADGLRT
jgi:hypothetical protein